MYKLIFRTKKIFLKILLAIIIVNVIIIFVNVFIIDTLNLKSNGLQFQFQIFESNKNSRTFNITNQTKVNACLFILIRNRELKEWIVTMREFEKNFNHKYNYPYIFMNNVPFSIEFKEKVLELTKSKVEFGLIPKEHWSMPKWINTRTLKKKLRTSLKKMWSGTKISYHHMCRYYSGFFFRHNLTLKYDYFWRIEPKVSFPCEITYDPFQVLIEKNKLYGFSIARPEMMDTIPSLWKNIQNWLNTGFRDRIPSNNAIEFISKDNGRTLDKQACTFFNNFEIGAFSVFRDQQYLDYFDYLDKTGGFFYERWGDSAINTFYLVLMLRKNQIHIFDDFPYFHPPRYFCPKIPPKNCDLSLIDDCKLVNTSEKCNNHWKNS